MAWREYNAGARADDSAGPRRKTRGETVLAALLHAVSKLVFIKTNAGCLIGTSRRCAYHWKEPMRFRLLKFIQMKNARPTIFLSGTKPQ